MRSFRRYVLLKRDVSFSLALVSITTKAENLTLLIDNFVTMPMNSYKDIIMLYIISTECI